MINQSKRLFSKHFRQTLTVFRGGIGGDEVKLTAIVIPTSPNDIQLLNEQERYIPSIKIFTLEPLERGDIVIHKGLRYVTKTLANWSDYGYYNQIGIRHQATAKSDSTGFTIT